MSKRFRLLLIVVLLGIAFAFLYPSLQWYFLLTPQVKELALSSRQQIKLHAERQAREALAELQAAPLADPLPPKYQFLLKPAMEKFSAEGRPAPKAWTLEEVFRGFPGKADLAKALETHYRDEILAAKELRDRTLQLGLDLRGGMRVLIRAKTEELEQTSGKALTAAEKNDAVKRALEVLNNRIDQFGLTEPPSAARAPTRSSWRSPARRTARRCAVHQGKRPAHLPHRRHDGLAIFRQYQAGNPAVLLDAAGNVATSRPGPAGRGTILRGVYTRRTPTAWTSCKRLHGAARRGRAVGQLHPRRPGDPRPCHRQAQRQLHPHRRGRGDLLQAHQRQRGEDPRRGAGQQGQGPGHASPSPSATRCGSPASRRRRPTTWPWCCAPARCRCRWRSSTQQAVGATLGEDAIRMASGGRPRLRRGHAVHAALLPGRRPERGHRPGPERLTSRSRSCRCSTSP